DVPSARPSAEGSGIRHQLNSAPPDLARGTIALFARSFARIRVERGAKCREELTRFARVALHARRPDPQAVGGGEVHPADGEKAVVEAGVGHGREEDVRLAEEAQADRAERLTRALGI